MSKKRVSLHTRYGSNTHVAENYRHTLAEAACKGCAYFTSEKKGGLRCEKGHSPMSRVPDGAITVDEVYYCEDQFNTGERRR